MIDRDAVPISNRSPYKRIDLASRRRAPKQVITEVEYQNGEIPDLELYAYDWNTRSWHLKP
jgi:hypothetical protein